MKQWPIMRCKHCKARPKQPIQSVRGSGVKEWTVTCVNPECPTINPQTGTGVKTFGYTAEEAVRKWNSE